MAAIRAEVARFLKPGMTYNRLRQSLYDRIIFAAGANVGVSRFFQLPVGQGTPAKTFLDTNLTLAGQIPSDHVFEVHAPAVYVASTIVTQTAILAATNPLADVNLFIHNAEFKFAIVSDVKFQMPVWKFGGGAGLAGFSSMASLGGAGANQGSVLVGTNGAPHVLARFQMGDYPVVIPPLQTMTVEINIPASITLGFDLDVWVDFDGILHRPALN